MRLKKLFFLMLICKLAINTAFAQAQQNSLLYEISGNGLQKPSYLYGTMHVSKKMVFRLSDEFFQSLKKCDIVALESDPSKWLGEMKQYGMFKNYDYKTYNIQFKNNDFYGEAFKIYFPTNETVSGLLGYDPDIINTLLFRNNNYSQNFEENTYIDLFIYQAANKWNKPVISLENIRTSLVQGELADLLDREAENAGQSESYDSFLKLETAYRDGNIEEINKITRENTARPNFIKYILDERNVTFANAIDSVLKLNKSLFSGVGAAHLAGEQGLIELLKQKGYTVKVVLPSITPNGIKAKADIDAIIKPVATNKYFSPDSLFSYTAPGEILSVTDLNGIQINVFPEMVNGVYYNIFRLKTFSGLNAYNAEKYLLKIDSLMYESIPGKILSKTDIVNTNGNKGFAVTTSTKNGDILNHLIYITNTEVIIFKVGSSLALSKTPLCADFIKSIQFYNKKKTVTDFVPPNGGFTISSATDNFYEKYYPAGLTGLAERYFSYDKASQSFSGVLHAYYYDYLKTESDTTELSIICKKFSDNFTDVTDFKKQFDGNGKLPQLIFSFTASSNFINGKIIVLGCNYYLIFTANPQNNNDSYVKTFKLLPAKYTNIIKMVDDKDIFFSALDEVTADTADLQRDVYKAYYAVKPVKDSTAYLSKYNSKAYFSPSTGEKVNIDYWKYNDYDFVNEEEVLTHMTEYYKGKSLMKVSSKKVEKAGMLAYEFEMRSARSSKKIKSLVFVKGGTCYALSVPYDSIIGIPEWSQNFINSFKIKDTLIGTDVFKNKYPELFANLSENTNPEMVKKMTNVVSELSFNNLAEDDYIRFLGSEQFHKVNGNIKSYLFYNSAFVKNPAIIPIITKLYDYYSDSSLYQANMLEGLIKAKTQRTTDLFLKLITKNPPLLKDQSMVLYLFNSLYDSLELCKDFSPKILSLTRFEEYKKPVYQLMSELASKKIIKPSSYSKFKESLYQEALYEYKRMNSNSYLNLNDPQNQLLNQNLLSYIYFGIQNEEYNVSKAAYISEYIPFVNLANLLMPFYNKDSEIKTFINKLMLNKKQLHVFPVYCSALQNNAFIDNELNEYYMVNAVYRITFYAFINRNNIQSVSDFGNGTSFKLLESFLAVNNYNSGDNTFTKLYDSHIFIDSLDVHNEKDKGKLYVYRNFKLGEPKESWTILFLNDDKKDNLPVIEILNAYYVKNKDEEKDVIFNKIKLDFNYRYNTRYYSDFFSGY